MFFPAAEHSGKTGSPRRSGFGSSGGMVLRLVGGERRSGRVGKMVGGGVGETWRQGDS